MSIFRCWRTPRRHSVPHLGGISPARHLGANAKVPRYAFAHLKEATNRFNEDSLVGNGGFGKVYKGVLSNGTKIAVKRRDPDSEQGPNEFRAEIEHCSGLRHCNVVSLLGYCDQGGEMMLVYEYMEQGTLASHLYGSPRRSHLHLIWKQRLKILIEAARGLQYLHTGSDKVIIHRDVKSSNILLDDNLVAKISDLGLAKVVPELGRSHVTTQVKGTRGYLDYEYYISNQLTPESDVYAFAVVLLEALCGRKALDRNLPEEQMSLAILGKKKLEEGRLQEIVDPSISGTITQDALKKLGEIVKKCLADNRKDRPSMDYVVNELNDIQKLQDAVSPASDIGNTVTAACPSGLPPPGLPRRRRALAFRPARCPPRPTDLEATPSNPCRQGSVIF